MSKKFLIAGSIVDTDEQRYTFEDVTPAQINSFLNSLDENEDFELEITSYGGSVPAGIAICNLLKKASAEGHKSTAHVIGIAASMASAIACACDTLKMDANAFLMVHNPWTIAMGNANDMRKEADTLDVMRDALLAVYRTKFDVDDDAIKNMLDAETWILGSAAETFNLNAEVIPTEEPLKIAASSKMPAFMHIPMTLKDMIMKKEEEMKEQADSKAEAVEVKAEETAAEPVVEEPKAAEEAVEEPKDEEMVPKAEADKRVSGMQSAMAKQMDAMKKEYEAKIADFEVQIKAKDEELTKAMAEVTSLTDSLAKTEKELSEMTSAFEDKKNALEALNASVNTPNVVDDKPWKKLSGDALLEYCRTHKN